MAEFVLSKKPQLPPPSLSEAKRRWSDIYSALSSLASRVTSEEQEEKKAKPGSPILSRIKSLLKLSGGVSEALDPSGLSGFAQPVALTHAEAADALRRLGARQRTIQGLYRTPPSLLRDVGFISSIDDALDEVYRLTGTRPFINPNITGTVYDPIRFGPDFQAFYPSFNKAVMGIDPKYLRHHPEVPGHELGHMGIVRAPGVEPFVRWYTHHVSDTPEMKQIIDLANELHMGLSSFEEPFAEYYALRLIGDPRASKFPYGVRRIMEGMHEYLKRQP